MRAHVTKIQCGRDVLILGDADTMQGVPSDMRRRSAVCGVLRRMMSDAHAMRQLRQYWAARSLALPNGHRTDHQLVEVVEAAIESGAVPAMVLPDHGPHVRDLQTAMPSAQPPPRTTARTVAQMTPGERLWEVVQRAAKKLPAAAGEALLALFTPENIVIAIGLGALAAEVEATPVGWGLDLVLVAVAVGFGGVAALQSIKDLLAFIALTISATTESDLDEAADHLARLVTDVGVMWLMAILHGRAKRGTGGGEGERDVLDPSFGSRLRGTPPRDHRPPPGPGERLKSSDAGSFFDGTQYTSKVQSQMSGGAGEFHSFPESVKAFEQSGTVRTIVGGDGVPREMLTIPGSYKTTTDLSKMPPGGTWYDGEYQFIKEPNGDINHRLFVPNRPVK